jgi:hypothetical protein
LFLIAKPLSETRILICTGWITASQTWTELNLVIVIELDHRTRQRSAAAVSCPLSALARVQYVQFPSLPVSSYIIYKATKSCLEGQQRADITSKTAVRPVTTGLVSHIVVCAIGPTLRVYAGHRHGIQCAKSTTGLSRFINPK